MPVPQIIPLPPNFELSDGMQIRITAVDATTNATVSGVVVSSVSIDVDPVADSTYGKEGPFLPGFSLGDLAA